jgi:hypothetical protein
MLALDGDLWFVALPLTILACLTMLITACWARREQPIVSKERDGFKVRRDLRKKGGDKHN